MIPNPQTNRDVQPRLPKITIAVLTLFLAMFLKARRIEIGIFLTNLFSFSITFFSWSLVLKVSRSTAFSFNTFLTIKKETKEAKRTKANKIRIDWRWKNPMLTFGRSQSISYLIPITLGIIKGPMKKPNTPPKKHKKEP